MKFKALLLITLIINLSCSSDDSENNKNGFSVNGKFYTTGYAYNDPGSYEFIFSSADKTQHSYKEILGKFNLHHPDFFIEPRTYTTSNGGIFGVVQFKKGIEIENGQIISFGDDIAITCCAESNDNNFESGSVTVNTIEYNNEQRATYIDLDYTFRWQSKTIKGNFSGQVFEDPN